jgi:hypothetical protein
MANRKSLVCVTRQALEYIRPNKRYCADIVLILIYNRPPNDNKTKHFCTYKTRSCKNVPRRT